MSQFLAWNECEELTHSQQQQPQAPKTHKKKPTIRKAIRTVFHAPQRSLLYRLMLSTQIWIKSTNLELNEPVLGLE